MIENLKELLGSEDQELVKQGIELILNLGMEEELYLGFEDLLDDSDLNAVGPGPKLLDLFQCVLESNDDSWDDDSWDDEEEEPRINLPLAQTCLLALIKVLNKFIICRKFP